MIIYVSVHDFVDLWLEFLECCCDAVEFVCSNSMNLLANLTKENNDCVMVFSHVTSDGKDVMLGGDSK